MFSRAGRSCEDASTVKELGTMADSHAKQHDYHLVDPSPWPIIGSIATFVLALGAICGCTAPGHG